MIALHHDQAQHTNLMTVIVQRVNECLVLLGKAKHAADLVESNPKDLREKLLKVMIEK
ncbi:hypothetical protein [Terasakiella sp. SH-1]|uniref:hypothetical protein n=1 Tax=Terasakiella sp. SH-1 TaxID=2560057 RepID=UPI0014308886|nr:hypothetical protein [Terasakiella sp. SH-1]